jgi:hypothetical protein
MMRFLTRLLSRFGVCTQRSSLGFDQIPERREVLSRFIFSKNYFSAPQNRVKPGAFLPSEDPLETSIFRGDGLNREQIRRNGDEVGVPSGRALKAWGDVPAGGVFDLGLDVRPDNIPERHAAIIGWPEQKDEQISLAQQLAEAATLQLPP